MLVRFFLDKFLYIRVSDMLSGSGFTLGIFAFLLPEIMKVLFDEHKIFYLICLPRQTPRHINQKVGLHRVRF